MPYFMHIHMLRALSSPLRSEIIIYRNPFLDGMHVIVAKKSSLCCVLVGLLSVECVEC